MAEERAGPMMESTGRRARGRKVRSGWRKLEVEGRWEGRRRDCF